MKYNFMRAGLVILVSLAITGCPPVKFEPSVAPTTPLTQPTIEPPTPTDITHIDIATPSQTEPELYITVTGVGIAPSTEVDPVRRERAAIRAAETDAARNFAKWQEGAQLEAVTIVNQGALEVDMIRETVKATVHLGKMIEQQYDKATGTALVTVSYTINVKK